MKIVFKEKAYTCIFFLIEKKKGKVKKNVKIVIILFS